MTNKLITEMKKKSPRNLPKRKADIPNIDDERKYKILRDSLPMDKIEEWHINEYTKLWQCSKMPNIANTRIDPKLGSITRAHSLSSLKYRYMYNTMDMIIIVMKLYDHDIRKETNYGTLFCELMSDMPALKRNMIKPNQVINNVVFSFYSASPSYVSCDGEYRSRFSLWESFISTRSENMDIWEDLEEYVKRIRMRRNWSIYTTYFYPKMEQELKNSEVEYAIKSEFIPLNVLTISWFHTIFDEMLDITKMHVNPDYKTIMLGAKDDDIAFVKLLIQKYGAERIETFRSNISHRINNFHNNSSYMQCGYKMIPLNIKEVQDPLRLRYKPWREFFISNKTNEIVLNNISPGFSIINDWFYIKNSRKGLFDNKSQYDRLKHSELARDILHILYEAQRGTYFATENLRTVNKTSSGIKRWISSKFKRLSEKIDDPINYSIEEIIMSEVTLAFTNEYVGRTVADSLLLLQKSKHYDSMLGHPFKPSGYDYFVKYIFEICYSLYCVNSKIGVIHGDLHLNNATIGAMYYQTADVMANKNKKNKVLYVLDDEHQYIFPNNCYFGALIDFSRGIINPNTYDVLRDQSLPLSYQLVDNEQKFRQTEISSLLNLYIQMFPNKMRQQEELIVLFKNNFDAVFRLLTCIDLYMFTIRLSRFLRQSDILNIQKNVMLIESINRMAEKFITVDMNHLINDPDGYGNKIMNEEWPILSIIKKIFYEYLDGNIYGNNLGVITDVYIYNNEMKYSLSHYDRFPDWMKYAKYNDNGNLININEVETARKRIRNEHEQITRNNLEMVNYIAKRHIQKLA